jgi:integrase
MPAPSKGPRLYLRRARYDNTGRITHPAVYLIRDGSYQRSSGCPANDLGGAERCLAEYIARKHERSARRAGNRDPKQIPIADVLTIYLRDIVSNHARPRETKARMKTLEKFFGDKMLSFVTGQTCREYAGTRSTEAAARRELEELRAAINHHRREGLHDRIVSVVLPPKSTPREDWLECEQAAALIWRAWRYREVQEGDATVRYTRRHVARFMIFARYMGSRASVICNASIETVRPIGLPWCDLRHGVFYGLPQGQRETKKRRQKVRIPTPLLAHLRRWRRKGQRYVVEWNGEPVKRITKAHNAVVRAAGLGKKITPHIWRHSVASWLMQRGADPWKSAQFLAMSVETLLRVYGHHRADDSADVHGALVQRATPKRVAI